MVAIGLYSIFVQLNTIVLFMGTAALFAVIGLLEPKYVSFSKFMSAFFISAAGVSSYFSKGNVYIAILALIFLLLVILQEFKSSKGMRSRKTRMN
jgi:fucose permease